MHFFIVCVVSVFPSLYAKLHQVLALTRIYLNYSLRVKKTVHLAIYHTRDR